MRQHFSSFSSSGDFRTGFFICISNFNTIYSYGKNIYGSHAFNEENINSPLEIKSLSDIKMISCDILHSICLNYSGEVFSFGSNEFGLLGIGKEIEVISNTHIPQKLTLPIIKQVSCGYNFTMCLSEDGYVFTFGDNKDGQLGLANTEITNLSSPQQIPNLYNIELIVCGASHVICKSIDDSIFYSWGLNDFSQLGNETFSDDVAYSPLKSLNWPENIVDIKCGDDHSLLLNDIGQVYSFGNNNYGQLGINDKNIKSLNKPTLIKDIPEIQRIECGYYQNIFIDIDNNLWLCGGNEYGQLGLDVNENKFKPIKYHKLKDIIDISSGGDVIYVKTSNNEIYSLAQNRNAKQGALIEDIEVPIRVFIDKEYIWCSTIGKSRQKSARK